MRVTVHIPDRLGSRVKQAVHDEGLSLSAMIAKALGEYLKQERRRAAGNRLPELIGPNPQTRDAWDELEEGRLDDLA